MLGSERNPSAGYQYFGVRELAVELSQVVDKTERIIERFLVNQVLLKGKVHGNIDAKSLVGWMVMEGLRPDCNGDPYHWASMQISTAARNGIKVFILRNPNGVQGKYRWSIP